MFVQNNRAFVLVSGSRDNSNDNNDDGVLESESTMSTGIGEGRFRVGAARRYSLTYGTKNRGDEMVKAGRKRSHDGDAVGAIGKDVDLPSVRMHLMQDREVKRRGVAARRFPFSSRMQGMFVGIFQDMAGGGHVPCDSTPG
jgi:hypothetical protein